MLRGLEEMRGSVVNKHTHAHIEMAWHIPIHKMRGLRRIAIDAASKELDKKMKEQNNVEMEEVKEEVVEKE